jgi:ELWxxDGT repeat protein
MSDGTTTGTAAIADIKVSSAKYAVLNNKIYFAGDATSSNPINDQLWQTDGTAAGTSLVKTINPTGGAGIFNLFPFGGKIYFGASDGINIGQLWVSDGTANGTYLLKMINPTGIALPSDFVAYNGKVYFRAYDAENGGQLWVTDGTPEGTLRITTINAPGTPGLQPTTFTLFNSRLFFMGSDTTNFYQLFSTDGTASGTEVVKADHTFYGSGVDGFHPASMAVHNNKLYISGYDSVSATTQLWVSDGTTAGTTKVTSFPLGLYADRLYSFQSRLIMTGYDTISGQVALFASDGTALGTVCPTPPDTWGQYPFYPWEAWVPFNNALYYKAAYAYFADYQLCRYLDNSAGIEESTQKRVLVYPNPAKDQLTIEFSDHSNLVSCVRIYNSVGRIVFQTNKFSERETIDISHLSPGFYFVTLDAYRQKFIKR